MRKVALQMYLSLDGVMEAPEKWTSEYCDDDHERYAYSRLVASNALLLGRSTYETFAASWPKRIGDDFIDRMNTYPKYVISQTLQDPEWNNSHVLPGDTVTDVSKLKGEPGKDIMVYGSARLVNTLLQHGLIDDCRIWMFPVIVGSGKRLFPESNEKPSLNSSIRTGSTRGSSCSATSRSRRTGPAATPNWQTGRHLRSTRTDH